MPDSDRLKDVLRSVADELTAGRNARAVHRFAEAASHYPVLRDKQVVTFLKNSLGAKSASMLVRAFAEQGCMACKSGLLICEECLGAGILGKHRVCDLCLGLGAMNCDFCAGSGWITYNYVPAGLREAVALMRTQLTLDQGKIILAARLPDPANESVSISRKQLARALLMLNRVVSALNNAVEVMTGGDPSPVQGAVIAACLKAEPKLQKRLRELIRLLGACAGVELEGSRSTGNRRIAQNRREFYELLAKSPDFRGTRLYHLYLDELSTAAR